MTHHAIVRASRPTPSTDRGRDAASPGSRRLARGIEPRSDPRWPRVVETLVALRDAGRFSVRIVDVDCGTGALLIDTVRAARRLGFIAIEGRGIDGAPSLVARARQIAANDPDPAIGLIFEVADVMQVLAEEAEFPADIMLWHGRQAVVDHARAIRAVMAAGRHVVCDTAPVRCGGAQ